MSSNRSSCLSKTGNVLSSEHGAGIRVRTIGTPVKSTCFFHEQASKQGCIFRHQPNVCVPRRHKERSAPGVGRSEALLLIHDHLVVVSAFDEAGLRRGLPHEVLGRLAAADGHRQHPRHVFGGDRVGQCHAPEGNLAAAGGGIDARDTGALTTSFRAAAKAEREGHSEGGACTAARPHVQGQNAEYSERDRVACAQRGGGRNRGGRGGRQRRQRPTGDLGTHASSLQQHVYMYASYTLDVLQSDDEDVHQHHLCLPARAPRDGVDQVVVDLLGGLVV